MSGENKIPDIENPDGFDTVPELRRELNRVKVELLACAEALKERDAVGCELAGLIDRVLMQHVLGDHRGVAAILDARLEGNPRLRERLEEANESAKILQAQRWDGDAREKREQESLPPYNCGGDDPWSTMTVQELRKALDIANRTGVVISSELVAVKDVLNSLTGEVSKIVVAHVTGGADAVLQTVSTFCEKRVVVKGDLTRKVH